MYRMVETDTWDDPWFADLESDAKLLFLYFVTNRRSTTCGAFEITVRAMSFETGLESARIESILRDRLASRVQWWPQHSAVWVRNFYRHQKANDKFRINAQRTLAKLPREVREEVCIVYPELASNNDTPSIPDAYHIDTQSTVLVLEAVVEENGLVVDETAESLGVPKRTVYPKDFEQFWTAYPPGRGNKKKTAEIWARLKPSDDLQSEIHDGLARWKACRRWRVPDYIISAQIWLRDRWWEDEPPMDDDRPRSPGEWNSAKRARETGQVVV